MHRGSTGDEALSSEFRTLGGTSFGGGADGSRSVSIIPDICVSAVPNCDQRRQIKKTGLSGSPFSCPPAPIHTEPFLQRNQPVASSMEDRSRQLKSMVVRPEEDQPGMATLQHLGASLFYGVFSGILQTQRRRLMAKTEV
jgi:hypothetical protein